MNQPKPTKEQVREYMEHRQAEHRPPPDIKEIRRQLGWENQSNWPYIFGRDGPRTRPIVLY